MYELAIFDMYAAEVSVIITMQSLTVKRILHALLIGIQIDDFGGQ